MIYDNEVFPQEVLHVQSMNHPLNGTVRMLQEKEKQFFDSHVERKKMRRPAPQSMGLQVPPQLITLHSQLEQQQI